MFKLLGLFPLVLWSQDPSISLQVIQMYPSSWLNSTPLYTLPLSVHLLVACKLLHNLAIVSQATVNQSVHGSP